jgi:hypothetical protein
MLRDTYIACLVLMLRMREGLPIIFHVISWRGALADLVLLACKI